MATYSQPQFTILVANFSRPTPSRIVGADPGTNGPTKIRAGFIFGHVGMIGVSRDLTPTWVSHNSIVNTFNVALNPFEADPPNLPTGIVTVTDNTFSPGSAVLIVGPYDLVAYRDWIPGGGPNATAMAIANAINTMNSRYTAVVAGADITVTGPLGSGPESIAFSARYGTSIQNFTFTYTGVVGYLGYTDSPLFVGELPPPPINYYIHP